MKITDFVKPGIKSTAHIIFAEKMIQPQEELMYAGLFDCNINGAYQDNRLVANTSHRLLLVNGFASPPHKLAYIVGPLLQTSNVTGLITKTVALTAGNDVIQISGKGKDIDALLLALQKSIVSSEDSQTIQFTPTTTSDQVPTFIDAPEIVNPPSKKKEQTQERISDNHAAGVACCPKCGSTSLSAHKRGFSAGKAAVGMLTVGGILMGAVGSNKVDITCLNCGHKFRPGK